MDKTKAMVFCFINSFSSGLFCALLFLSSCNTYKAKDFTFPEPVDTSDRPIEFQQKTVYAIDGLYADNRFDGARLNNFELLARDTFIATISPENFPINSSAWYAFKLWSDSPKQIQLVLKYQNGRHRYPPKWSSDGKNWALLDSVKVRPYRDSNAIVKLEVGKDTMWLAAQELVTSADVRLWCERMDVYSDVRFRSIGQSKMGRDMFFLDIHSGSPKGKEVIVVLSRQHPPEVTGYFAMKHFIEEIMASNPLAKAFRNKYRMLVFPLMNPDGVDLGHWRHNTGGIDLNRDWAYYRQPETRQVADFIVKETRKSKNKVLLGLDFHSTWQDVYYTGSIDLSSKSNLPNYKDYWLLGIENALPGYDADDQPSGLGAPVTKGWFYQQFNAESVTYEIGDRTPRPFIKDKSRVAAMEMMQLLIYRK